VTERTGGIFSIDIDIDIAVPDGPEVPNRDKAVLRGSH
jgi:hypothetical protein